MKVIRILLISLVLISCSITFATDWLSEGDTYYRNEDYDKAISAYSNFIAANAENPTGYEKRGHTYVKKGEFDLAICDFKKALSINQDKSLYNLLAWTYRISGQYNVSIEACDQALKVDANYFAPYFNKAAALESLGLNDEALSNWRLCLQYINTDSPDITYVQERIKALENNPSFINNLLSSKDRVLRDESVWEVDGILVRGNKTNSFEAFDSAMIKFMKEHSIKAGTLAISKDGVFLIVRGYSAIDSKYEVHPDSLIRIASVTKPITAAAIQRLINEDKLTLEMRGIPILTV